MLKLCKKSHALYKQLNFSRKFCLDNVAETETCQTFPLIVINCQGKCEKAV